MGVRARRQLRMEDGLLVQDLTAVAPQAAS
jgi:hypothetical protein